MRPLSTLGLCFCAAVAVTAVAADDACATTVRFTSNVGTFDVDLFDTLTPQTVANFLSYVNAGLYNNSFIHRSVAGFVVQGGGYYNDTNFPPIPTFAPIPNEFFSERAALPAGTHINVRGTIAMATRYGDPHSATSQFFFNLVDNSGIGTGPGGTTDINGLDFQNGGFTTFGTVTGSGMNVLDAIAGLPVANAGGSFTDLPLAGDGAPVLANLVTFSSVTVIPEPASATVAVAALACVAATRRQRRSD
jgi:cyclophilin family peptidyl-prolyl cis-trans isomerase